MKTFITIAAVSAIAITSLSSFKFDPKAAPAPAPGIVVTKVGNSPIYPDAALKVKNPEVTKVNKDSTKLSFAFEVSKYDLKAQTADNATKSCANSKDGQHIHFILDNQPYKALYEPKNEVTLANGSEHYLLCFLSRSYHESLKNKAAAVMIHFKIDENGKYIVLKNPKTPVLFYSRPKGDYIGKDTANILLDFYVYNGILSSKGFKVKAEISNQNIPGRQLTTTITTWDSHFIQNLGTGKCKVALTLLDKNGAQVDGPLTTVSREFNLSATDIMKK